MPYVATERWPSHKAARGVHYLPGDTVPAEEWPTRQALLDAGWIEQVDSTKLTKSGKKLKSADSDESLIEARKRAQKSVHIKNRKKETSEEQSRLSRMFSKGKQKPKSKSSGKKSKKKSKSKGGKKAASS